MTIVGVFGGAAAPLLPRLQRRDVTGNCQAEHPNLNTTLVAWYHLTHGLNRHHRAGCTGCSLHLVPPHSRQRLVYFIFSGAFGGICNAIGIPSPPCACAHARAYRTRRHNAPAQRARAMRVCRRTPTPASRTRIGNGPSSPRRAFRARLCRSALSASAAQKMALPVAMGAGARLAVRRLCELLCALTPPP